MNYKYFGFLNEDKFKLLNAQERLDYVLQHNLVQAKYSVSFGKLPEPDVSGEISLVMEFTNDNLKYDFVREIGVELRDFLLQHYRLYLGADVIMFQKDFESDTYGFNKEEKKQIGLKFFNQFFYECCERNDQRFLLNENDKEGNQLELRFTTIKRKREELAFSLRYELEMVGQFLIGNSNCFNKELFHTSDLIKKIFILENNCQILEFLNDQFEFENENNLSTVLKTEEIFQKFNMKFKSKSVVLFIDSLLSDSSYRERKFGLGLFYCLKKELKQIKFSAEDFKDFCNDYYDCNFINLRLGHDSNSHLEIVEDFKEKWIKFDK